MPDNSVSVPLKVLASDVEGDLEFPRLDDLRYESVPGFPSNSSRFLINIRRSSGEASLLEVSADDTVLDTKRRIPLNAGSTDLMTVEFSGEILDNERTLSSYGVASGAELSVRPYTDDKVHHHDVLANNTKIILPISETRGIDLTPEAEIRGLADKARARVLYYWNGVTTDGQSLGLPLHAEKFVMVGRVVNKDWFEGYLPDDLDRCGYIPRNYVEIESLYDEAFRQKLGPDAHSIPMNSTAHHPSPPPRRRWNFPGKLYGSMVSICGKKPRMDKELNLPTNSKKSAPPLPPSPFPSKPPVPILDLLDQGNRVRLDFSLENESPGGLPLVKVVLSLVSAPESRISYATVELEFEHDTIASLEPKRGESAATEVHHTTSVENELSATGTASYGPVELLGLTAKRTDSKLAEYSRRTRGTVVGDGEGSSKAYWVFKEDSGEAARFGLDSEQRMSVALHARPVRVDYQVNARVVTDDGKTGGWFGTKRLSSGRQRFYFRF